MLFFQKSLQSLKCWMRACLHAQLLTFPRELFPSPRAMTVEIRAPAPRFSPAIATSQSDFCRLQPNQGANEQGEKYRKAKPQNIPQKTFPRGQSYNITYCRRMTNNRHCIFVDISRGLVQCLGKKPNTFGGQPIHFRRKEKGRESLAKEMI